MGGSGSLLAIAVFTSLMIIDDLDALCGTLMPVEADSPLVIDPDAVLTLPVATQSLKPVFGDGCQVLQVLGIIQHAKLPSGDSCNVAEPAALLPIIELFVSLQRKERITRPVYDDDR
jgi:hypothetical protein